MSGLAVELRNESGKGVARKLRAAGRIPAVLYGHGKEPLALSLDPRVLEKQLSEEGHNALFDLSGDGAISGRTVLVKEVQRHPVRGTPLHADLFEIDANEKIHVQIEVHVVGTAKGVSLDRGLLDHVLREVEVECLPRAIPERIDIDVSELRLGESIHASDLQLPDGVDLRTNGELAVVAIAAPTVEAEPVAAEGAEGEDAGEDGKDAAAEAEGGSGGD